MVTQLNFGQHVTVDHKLKRVWDRSKGEYRFWKRVEMSPKLVMVIGKRTLSNGKVHFDGDDGIWFEPKEHIQAYLVVENMQSKPFYIEAL